MSTCGAISHPNEWDRGTTCSRRCLEAKKALANVAVVREKEREQGQDEVKLMSIDVKKAHLNAKRDEEEWVELPDELRKFGSVPS